MSNHIQILLILFACYLSVIIGLAFFLKVFSNLHSLPILLFPLIKLKLNVPL